MAMGKPVIVADDSGASDYITHGVNGLIVPSGDATSLRAAIRSTMDQPALAEKLADNAKAIYGTYTTPKCMERILKLAEQIVSTTRPNRARRLEAQPLKARMARQDF